MNFYDILEVSPHAEPDEIKIAFRRLAKKYHPDINENIEASDRFQLIYLAYDILQDTDKRKIYDELQIWKRRPPRTGREADDMRRWENISARQARTYSQMPCNEFESTFLSKLGFHSLQVLAFCMFFFLLVAGLIGLMLGGHYVFVAEFSGSAVLGYGLWLFGLSFTYTSAKALLGIFETWRN